MRERGGRLVTTDEPAVVSKPLLDGLVMKKRQSDRGLANSGGADESEWSEVSHQVNDLVASKEDPRWRWQGFSRCAKDKCRILDPSAGKVAGLV